MGGINTDDLERLLIQHDLLGAPHLFFFEPAVTDGPMHHLTDAGDDQQGAGALTAREVVAEMRKSDKRLGSGKCEGGFVGRSPSKPCAKQRKKKRSCGRGCRRRRKEARAGKGRQRALVAAAIQDVRAKLRDERSPPMAICWLRIFLHRLTDQELALELHRVGLEGIRTDELEALLRKYDLFEGPALFVFEHAGTAREMHHLYDLFEAPAIFSFGLALTAREIVGVMRRSDHKLGSGDGGGGNAFLTPPPSVWFWHLADGMRRDAREEEAHHRLPELGRDVRAGLEVVHEEAVAAAQEEEETAAANAVMAAEVEVQAEAQRSGHWVQRAVTTTRATPSSRKALRCYEVAEVVDGNPIMDPSDNCDAFMSFFDNGGAFMSVVITCGDVYVNRFHYKMEMLVVSGEMSDACDEYWVSDDGHVICDAVPSPASINGRTHVTNKPKSSCYPFFTIWGGNGTVFPAFDRSSSSSGSASSSGGDEDLITFIEEEETAAANAVMAAEAEELGEALRSKHWIPSAMHGDLIASIELGRERWLEKVAAAREDEETAASNAVMAAEAEEQDESLRSGHWHPLVCPNRVKMVGLRRGLFFPTPPRIYPPSSGAGASAPRLEALYEETTMPGSGAGGGGGVYGSAGSTDDDDVVQVGATKEQNAQDAAARRERARQIQLHMELLVHASGCDNQACPSANSHCGNMKALLKHGATCPMRATGGCHICVRCWALLQIHARQCRQTEGAPAGRCYRYRACPVPRCRDLKEHLRRLQRRCDLKEEEEEEVRRRSAGGTQWRTFSAAHHSVCACSSVVTQTINEEDSLVTVGRRMEGATRHCMEVVLRSDDPHGVSLALHGGRNIEIGVVAWGMLHPTEDDFIAAEIESDVRTPEEYFAQRPFMDPSAPHREWMVSTSSCTTGDTIQVILDLEAGALHFFKNGAKHGHGFPPGSVVGPVVFGVILCNEGDAVQLLRERQIPRQRTGYEPTKVTRCSCFTTKPGSGTPSIDPPGGGPPPLKEEEEEEEVRRRLPTPPASAPRLEALYEETTMKDERPGSGTPSIDPPGGGSYFLGEVKMREEEIPDGFEGDFTYPGHVDGYFPPEYATLYVDENMKHYYKDAQGVRRYTDDADADELQIIRARSRRDADGEEHKWHKRGRTLDALLF